MGLCHTLPIPITILTSLGDTRRNILNRLRLECQRSISCEGPLWIILYLRFDVSVNPTRRIHRTQMKRVLSHCKYAGEFCSEAMFAASPLAHGKTNFSYRNYLRKQVPSEIEFKS